MTEQAPCYLDARRRTDDALDVLRAELEEARMERDNLRTINRTLELEIEELYRSLGITEVDETYEEEEDT